MPRIIISTSNDISTDNRVNKVAVLLREMGFDVLWVGRRLKSSLKLEREYDTHRMKLVFTSGALFYAEFNIRLFFFLLFNKADVLLSNDLDTLLPNYLVSRLRKRELVYDSHEYFLGVPELEDNRLAKWVWTRIEKSIFPRLSTVFTVNESIANLYLKDYGIKPIVFRNISPRIELDRIKTRKELSLPENKYILINQGSGINVDRGMEEALESLKFLDNTVLLLVGSGDAIPFLKNKVTQDNLEDRVIFVNRVPYAELLQYTRNADIGLSLDKDTNINYRYSLPNKLFDYIHCSLPVVCSGVVEVSKIVREFQIGEVIESHSPEHIAKAIKRIQNMESGFYDNNLKNAAATLNWEKEKDSVVDAYQKILDRVKESN